MAHYPIIVAIEGIHGAGKSLVLAALRGYLISVGKSVGVYEFHQQDWAKRVIQNYTEADYITPELISAALCMSFLSNAVSAVKSNYDFVLFHRYKYTGLFKDIRHGLDPKLAERNYDLAPPADIVAYLRISPELALERVLKRGGISFYETGYLYTWRAELNLMMARFKRGELPLEQVKASFLEERQRECNFFDNRLCREPGYLVIDATDTPENILSKLIVAVTSFGRKTRVALHF
jgi:dTMP kinase